MKRIYSLLLFWIVFFVASAQNPIICPVLEMHIRIDNSDYIPEIENNVDNTITLIFNDSEITDLFSNYDIYEFYQNGPAGSVYTIICNSKELLNDINDNVDPTIMTGIIDQQPIFPQSTIDKLDNKTMIYEWHCFKNLENEEEFCGASYTEVPNNFNLILQTHYDVVNDVIVMESVGLTPCGNTFELGFKAGTTDYLPSLSLWYANLHIVNDDIQNPQSFINAETFLMNMLGTGCEETLHYGDLLIETFVDDASIIRFVRDWSLNVYDRASFRYTTLGIDSVDNNKVIRIVKLNDHQAKIEGLDAANFLLTVYELSGKTLTINYTQDSKIIDISQLSKGLYIFNVSLPDDKIETVKFFK